MHTSSFEERLAQEAETASTFGGGGMAVSGGIGLLLEIIGTYFVMRPKRRKEEG